LHRLPPRYEGSRLERSEGITVAALSGWGGIVRPAATALWLLVALTWSGLARAETLLRLGLPVSLDNPASLNILEFARQVRARTMNAIKIEPRSKERRQEEHEVLAEVASGNLEIGVTTLNQVANDVPLARAFLQPFLFNFDALIQAATAHENEVRALIDRDILRWTNARVLWWQPYGSSVIFSRRSPTTNPSVIAARAIGTTDDQSRELIGVCGGVPRRVVPADVFRELQRGSVEAAVTDIMNVRERELWRVADTITDLRHSPSLLMIAINEDAWRRLTAEQQEIVTELAQDAQDYMWASFATIRAQAYAFAIEKGMRVVDLPPEDTAAWRACSAPLLETYMERTGEGGPKLFTAYGRLRTHACCRESPSGIPFIQQ
jgi:C4-dicarboxylate-binding protein DctP